jgi:murein DD-endopeptidase MepM/ murein hydrolase activator NlpD
LVRVLLAFSVLVGCARAVAPLTHDSPSLAVALSTDVDAGSPSGSKEAPTPVEPPAHDAGPLSPALRNPKLHSPMPGGFLGGWGGDTGLDIAGNRLSVYALAAGTLDYAEWGHTLWTRKPDTPYSIRLKLDEPIPWGDGRSITHVYYTHLSKVEVEQAEDAGTKRHVAAGEKIGVSGIGNGVPHLHLGLLLDNQVEQDSWTYILREGDIRKVMGGYKNGFLLPLK